MNHTLDDEISEAKRRYLKNIGRLYWEYRQQALVTNKTKSFLDREPISIKEASSLPAAKISTPQ